jgi:RND family efflux transporter MFP subunit
MKKLFILIIILLCLGLVGWQIYLKVSASAKTEMAPRRMSPPVAVEIEPVLQTLVRDVGHFTGSLYPKSQFIVAPKIGGRLEKLNVDIGDRVKKGQLIAVLEDEEFIQQLDQAKAELEVARARIEESRSNLDKALREYERAKALRSKQIASESELDSTEAQFKAQSAIYKVAVAQVTQKEAALKATQVRLAYTRIHATWDDHNEYRVVGERYVDEGSMLAPNQSIVSILDTSVLEAVIYVIERDYPKLRLGQKAICTTDAFPGKKFSGKINRIAPLLKETSREARVEIGVPNHGNLLKPGMFIRIELEFSEHENATVIPLTALIKKDGQEGIFLADTEEMKVQYIPVKLGIPGWL